MGLGVYFVGSPQSKLFGRTHPRELVHHAENWFRANCTETLLGIHEQDCGKDGTMLRVRLHPTAEDVEVVAKDNHVIVSAKTSTTGPGYHTYLCGLVRQFGDELKIAWEPPNEEGTGDETGYFYSGDRADLEGQMLEWLQAVVRVILERYEQDSSALAISMSMDYSFEHHGVVATPMGPRSIGWLKATSQDPNRGIDFFTWWPDGMGASYFLGLAVAQIWTDVRWRAPLCDKEMALMCCLKRTLAKAYDLDPLLDYPWREWAELLDYTDDRSVLADVVRNKALPANERPLIGYRRDNVRVRLPGGWSVLVPGSLAETWEESGETWCAWDSSRTVRLSSLVLKEKGGRVVPAEELLASDEATEDSIEHRGTRVIGRAEIGFVTEEDNSYWRLQGRVAAPGTVAICTVCFDGPADRDWAIATWKSIMWQPTLERGRDDCSE